jgi:hypothetical protein
MLYISNSGLTTMYIVTNDEGQILLYTSDSRMANYVNARSKGIDSEFRLRVGGDPGTKTSKSIWHHVRQFYK